MTTNNTNTELSPCQQYCANTIKRLTGQANTLAALLSVIHILEPDYRNDSMAAAASIAEDVAALVGVSL